MLSTKPSPFSLRQIPAIATKKRNHTRNRKTDLSSKQCNKQNYCITLMWKHGLGVMKIARNRLKASTPAGQPELVREHQSPAGRGGHLLAESRAHCSMATDSTCQPAPGQTQPRPARHGACINKLLECASKSHGNSIPVPRSAAMTPAGPKAEVCPVSRPRARLPARTAREP